MTPSYRLLALACRMSRAIARRLVRDDRIDVGIEEQRLHAREHRSSVSPARAEARAGVCGRAAAAANSSRRALQDELPRRQVVVRAGVDPEQLRIAPRSRPAPSASMPSACVRISSSTSRISRLCRVALIVVDVPACERGAIQMVDENLLVAAAAPRSRPRRAARRRRRRRARADRDARLRWTSERGGSGPFARLRGDRLGKSDTSRRTRVLPHRIRRILDPVTGTFRRARRSARVDAGPVRRADSSFA